MNYFNNTFNSDIYNNDNEDTYQEEETFIQKCKLVNDLIKRSNIKSNKRTSISYN